MNDEKKKALEAEIRSYVGKPIGPPVTGRDPINAPMIRQWCDAMGETHPAYLDADAAAKTVHGEIVVSKVPGDHYTILGRPNVLTLARDLQQALDAAEAQTRARQGQKRKDNSPPNVLGGA